MATTRKSRRIQKREELPPPLNSCEEGPTCGPRMNSILCNARLRCADVSSDVRTRLHIDSCAKCDLYESSVNPKKQDDVCQRRYGCRREKDEKYLDAPIKVRILWSVSGRSTPRNSSTISTTTGASYSSHSSTSNEKYTSYKRRLAALKGHAKRTKKHKDWCKKDSKLINILTAEVNKKSNDLVASQKKSELLVIENIMKETIINNQKCNLNKCTKKIEEHKLKQKILAKENSILETVGRDLEKKLNATVCKLDKLINEAHVNQNSKNNDLVEVINGALKGVRYEKRTTIILDLVYNGTLFGKKGKEVGDNYARQVMKKKFPAWKLCKAKDTAPQGCLNLQGLGQVRCVEELEKGEQGLFASKSTIWREGDELLKKVAIPLLVDAATYHQIHKLGDSVQLIYERLIRFALEDNGLTNIASEFSVEFGFSLDGGSMTQLTAHIFAGAKSLDLRSKKNGKFIFKELDEHGEEVFCNVQSNTNIYLMKIAYVKDGKTPYEEYFADWFRFIQQLKTEGLPARPEYGWKAVKPMQVCVPQDTSSIQKAIGMGGACKACNLFCHACSCTSYGPKSLLLFYREGRFRCRRFCLGKKVEFFQKNATTGR